MRKPIALSELLAKGNPALERLRAGARAADRTLSAVTRALDAELGGHVWGATLEVDRLVLLVDSAGWATRVRYAVPELKRVAGAELGTVIERVVVRVRPPPKPKGPTP